MGLLAEGRLTVADTSKRFAWQSLVADQRNPGLDYVDPEGHASLRGLPGVKETPRHDQ